MNELTDAVGRQHDRATQDVRIVSLVPSLTELLFSLGLDDQIVGRTTFCVHPKEKIDSVPRVGGTKTISFDRLRAARPTHVLVNIDENLREDVPKIEALGAIVVVTHPVEPTDNIHLYTLLGNLFNRTDQASALISAFAEAHRVLAHRREQFAPQSVLYLIWRDPWMTVSSHTYISKMLALVGWQTVPTASDDRYPQVAPSDPVWRDADLILLSTEPFPFKNKHAHEIASDLRTHRNGIHFIDGEMTSWYGSRAITGLQYLNDLALELAQQ